MAVFHDLRLWGQRRVGGPVLEAKFALARAPQTPPARRFVLFGRGRSGSTLLLSLLSSHPQVRCAGEELRYRTLAPAAHIRRVLAKGRAEVSGCKLLSYQMRSVHGMAPDTGFLRDLAADGVDILYLKRENLLSHGLSNLYARARRAYHSTDARAGQGRKIHLDPAELIAWMEGSEALNAYEDAVLKGVDALPLTYERDLMTPEAQAATHARLLARFGLAHAPARTDLRKVTPRALPDLVDNSAEVLKALRGTRFARFIEESARS
jgi:LPS sulfotransferase NodH